MIPDLWIVDLYILFYTYPVDFVGEKIYHSRTYA